LILEKTVINAFILLRSRLRCVLRKFSRFFRKSLCITSVHVKMRYKDPKSQELMSNTIYFFSRVIQFFREKMTPDVRSLAEKLYFPKGQIEADGLCAITGQIWTATYLLQAELSRLREADYDSIIALYIQLASESEQMMKLVNSYHGTLQRFKKKNLPVWQNAERHLQVRSSSCYTNDLDPPESVSFKRDLSKLYIGKELIMVCRKYVHICSL